jgi:hypothetical protein
VVEVAHGNYSQENYRDFIGFQVAQSVLERAFAETYGLQMRDVMKHQDLAVSTYRFAVSSLIPKMTKVAIATFDKDVPHATPGAAKSKFIYRMRRTEYESVYGRKYEKPGVFAHILAFFITILPKVGPLSAFKLKVPTSDEQTQYLTGVNATEDAYRATLGPIRDGSPAPTTLPEMDFDTGKPTAEGEYALADETYAWLVNQLAEEPTAPPADVMASIHTFYANPAAPDAMKLKKKKWARVQQDLNKLQTLPAAAPAPQPS